MSASWDWYPKRGFFSDELPDTPTLLCLREGQLWILACGVDEGEPLDYTIALGEVIASNQITYHLKELYPGSLPDARMLAIKRYHAIKERPEACLVAAVL